MKVFQLSPSAKPNLVGARTTPKLSDRRWEREQRWWRRASGGLRLAGRFRERGEVEASRLVIEAFRMH